MVKAAPETAEVNKTIDYGQMGKEELFKKNEEPFDKTAPIKFSE